MQSGAIVGSAEMLPSCWRAQHGAHPVRCAAERSNRQYMVSRHPQGLPSKAPMTS